MVGVLALMVGLTGSVAHAADPSSWVLRDIGSPVSGQHTWANAVSGKKVVGTVETATNWRAFWYDDARRDQGIKVLGTLGGDDSVALDVSGNWVVGWSATSTVQSGQQVERAFAYDTSDAKARMWDFAASGDSGSWSYAYAVSGNRVVGERDGRAFVFDLSKGTMTDLHTLVGGTRDGKSAATGIAGNVVVGGVEAPTSNPDEPQYQVFVYDLGTGRTTLLGRQSRGMYISEMAMISGDWVLSVDSAFGRHFTYQLSTGKRIDLAKTLGEPEWPAGISGAQALVNGERGAYAYDLLSGARTPFPGDTAWIADMDGDLAVGGREPVGGGSQVVAWDKATSPFRDVTPSTQFYDEITWLANNGISTGWDVPGGKEFRPVTPVNRDAMAAFMYRLAGSPAFTAPKVSPFRDVTPSTQFYKEITWLASKGISTGWDVPGGKEFRPVSPVNRDAMAAFMYRLKVVNQLV